LASYFFGFSLFVFFRTEENHMLAKYTVAGLAGSMLLASVAFAQSPTTPADTTKAPAPATASDMSSSFQGTWRASKMVGLSVYNDSNESLGSINDLLTDKSGDIKAVVIGVGGFLGVGEHLVAIPLDKIKFVNEPIVYTGMAGGPNSPGTRPPAPSTTTTTGAASTNTAPAATALIVEPPRLGCGSWSLAAAWMIRTAAGPMSIPMRPPLGRICGEIYAQSHSYAPPHVDVVKVSKLWLSKTTTSRSTNRVALHSTKP